MPHHKSNWVNCSVLGFAGGADPVQAIIDKARDVVFEALEKGYSGPPFNPFDLAEQLSLEIMPSAEVADARVISTSTTEFRIEFNPNMPKARRNFSIAHEIAHTFFPDCGDSIRNRGPIEKHSGDSWEIEMLCNIGAAEILMPIGSFPAIREETLDINSLLNIRQKYEVSTEAVLLRAIRLAEFPCFMFAASKDDGADFYKIDYAYPSPYTEVCLEKGTKIPSSTGISSCRAIGYTYSGREMWSSRLGELDIECVGIPAYPGKKYPRVVGIAKAGAQSSKSKKKIKYVVGNATEPHFKGRAIIAHIVNDKGRRWGGSGFAYAVSKFWPKVYKSFVEWCDADRSNFKLGNYHNFDITDQISVFTMIAQKGYGPSVVPRIRYRALAKGLDALYRLAAEHGAGVHMPRIGCGHGGGDWGIVSELIEDLLVRRGIQVTVYDLPPEERPRGLRQNSITVWSHLCR